MVFRSRRSSRIFGAAAAAVLFASSGCWIVAGLEDRTLIGGDPTEGGTNTEGGGDGSTDGSPDDGAADGGPKRCYIDDAFEKGGTLVPGLASPQREFSATFTENELEILVSGEWDFQSDASIKPRSAIWRARRPTRTATFTDISKLALDDTKDWGSPSIADDAGVVYLTRYEGATPATYRALRGDGGYTDDLVAASDDVSGTDYVTVDTADNTLYFAKPSDGGAGPLVIWKKTLARSGGADTSPIELKELSTLVGDGGYDIAAPVISRDKEVLYFVVSTRSLADNRVFRATAVPADASAKTDFLAASIREVTEVNEGSFRSFPVWVSPDLCRLYVSQLRGTGERDLYVYEKKPR